MMDSGPYSSDGESRAPRKHRYEQRSGRPNTRDSASDTQNGYNSERNPDRGHQERGHQERGHQERGHQERGHQERGHQERGHQERGHQERGHQERGHQERGHQERGHQERGHQERGHQERSQNRPRGADEHHGDRRQNSSREDRSRGHQQETQRHQGEQERSRDKRHHDGGHGRYEAERSRNRYEERDRYYRDSSEYEERSHKERSRHRPEEPERPRESCLQSGDRHGRSTSKEPEHYYPPERSFSPHGAELNDLDYYEADREGGILDCHKCRYLCTGRACCQLVEVLLNMLILICCSVSYSSTGGFTGITNMGGIYYYQYGGAYSGFSGADGVKAQELDVQFYNLKLPTVTASMAFGGALMTFSCLMVLLGVLRVPWRWPVCLLVECVLDIAIGVGYVPALYFYFRRLQDAYSTQVCKERESLYSSKGYPGFTCALHGADIAAALFACMAIIAFCMSAVLAIKGFRTVRLQKKKPLHTIDF